MKKTEILKATKQGLSILILMSFISSIGGTSLEGIKEKLFLIAPLIVVLPALNDMTGDFGSIIGSRYTTITYLGLKNKKKKLKELFKTSFLIALLMSVYISFLANLIHYLQTRSLKELIPTTIITSLTTIVIMTIIIITTTKLGDYLFKKGYDPDNYLIPITASLADLGSMTMMAILIIVLT